jgi:hypothetical protein
MPAAWSTRADRQQLPESTLTRISVSGLSFAIFSLSSLFPLLSSLPGLFSSFPFSISLRDATSEVEREFIVRAE